MNYREEIEKMTMKRAVAEALMVIKEYCMENIQAKELYDLTEHYMVKGLLRITNPHLYSDTTVPIGGSRKVYMTPFIYERFSLEYADTDQTESVVDDKEGEDEHLVDAETSGSTEREIDCGDFFSESLPAYSADFMLLLSVLRENNANDVYVPDFLFFLYYLYFRLWCKHIGKRDYGGLPSQLFKRNAYSAEFKMFIMQLMRFGAQFPSQRGTNILLGLCDKNVLRRLICKHNYIQSQKEKPRYIYYDDAMCHQMFEEIGMFMYSGCFGRPGEIPPKYSCLHSTGNVKFQEFMALLMDYPIEFRGYSYYEGLELSYQYYLKGVDEWLQFMSDLLPVEVPPEAERIMVAFETLQQNPELLKEESMLDCTWFNSGSTYLSAGVPREFRKMQKRGMFNIYSQAIDLPNPKNYASEVYMNVNAINEYTYAMEDADKKREISQILTCAFIINQAHKVLVESQYPEYVRQSDGVIHAVNVPKDEVDYWHRQLARFAKAHEDKYGKCCSDWTVRESTSAKEEHETELLNLKTSEGRTREVWISGLFANQMKQIPRSSVKVAIPRPSYKTHYKEDEKHDPDKYRLKNNPFI